MFLGIQSGFRIMGQSMKFFFKHPKAIFPIFMAWILYGGIATYIFITVDFSGYETTEILIVAYLFTFLFTFFVSIASLVLLELIEQNETKSSMSILLAMKDAFFRDLIRTLPIIIGWSIIKFLLLLLEVAIKAAEAKSRRGRRRQRRSSKFLETIKTGVRMGVMLMLSAIAWEEISPRKAMDKGMYIYKKYFASMATGVVLSRVLKFVIFLPLVIVIVIFSSTGTEIHEYVWYGLLLYTGLAWSYGILVEQLFTAELYLWHKKYQDQVDLAKEKGTKVPTSINDVSRPSFIDDIPDMVVKENTTIDPEYEW